MNTSTDKLRIASILIFALGIMITFLLSLGLTWASVEAEFYGFPVLGNDKLQRLECPYILSSSETGTVIAVFDNPTEKELRILTRIDISSPVTSRSEQEVRTFAPQATQRVPFYISVADRDLGFFIFARAYMYPSYGLRMREATCGILMLDLPLVTGSQFFVFIFVTGLLGIIAGLYLWDVSNRPMIGLPITIRNAMRFISVMVLVALMLSLRGAWLPAIPFLAVSVLASLTFLYIKK